MRSFIAKNFYLCSLSLAFVTALVVGLSSQEAEAGVGDTCSTKTACNKLQASCGRDGGSFYGSGCDAAGTNCTSGSCEAGCVTC